MKTTKHAISATALAAVPADRFVRDRANAPTVAAAPFQGTGGSVATRPTTDVVDPHRLAPPA